MVIRRILRPAAAGAIAFLALAAAPLQNDPGLTPAIKKIERGQWVLKDGAGAERRMCVRNPVALLTVHHNGAPCNTTVSQSDASSVTVSYSCPGHGNGRTSLSVETPRLVRIETSGIADGAPFGDEYEARRVGECR